MACLAALFRHHSGIPALPGRIFEAEVTEIPLAIAEGQLTASGQLPSIKEQRMTRIWPVLPSQVSRYSTAIFMIAEAFIDFPNALQT